MNRWIPTIADATTHAETPEKTIDLVVAGSDYFAGVEPRRPARIIRPECREPERDAHQLRIPDQAVVAGE